MITAEDVGAYKPALTGFEQLLERVGEDPGDILHVAFGFKYDIGPAKQLGYGIGVGQPPPGAAARPGHRPRPRMEGPVGPRRAVLFLTLIALAGCSGDDNDTTEPPVDAALAREQDKRAEADARNFVLLLETCFVEQQDYTRCLDAAGEEDVGQATVESSAPGEYTVISPSESGNEFRIEKGASSTLQRTCKEPGSGDCPASGRW